MGVRGRSETLLVSGRIELGAACRRRPLLLGCRAVT